MSAESIRKYLLRCEERHPMPQAYQESKTCTHAQENGSVSKTFTDLLHSLFFLNEHSSLCTFSKCGNTNEPTISNPI